MAHLIQKLLSSRSQGAARHFFKMNPYNKCSLHQGEPAHITAIVEQIGQLKFYEVAILNEALKRELKIPDQRVVAAPGPAEAECDEDTTNKSVKVEFSVKLTGFDTSKKVNIIKEIKKLVPGINLVEAKRFVEECPKIVGSKMSKEEAETLKKQLEEAGGTVKLE